MFHPSQKLLFGSTPNLSKLLHQPLPLNPRESHKLFNLLTSSFRKHLDEEYGELPPAVERPTVDNRGARRNSHSADLLPTDRHMSRILQNPLFTSTGSSRSISPRDPMEVFEAAVSRGMMDVGTALNCLRAKKGEILESSAINIWQAMGESKAATRVLKWLLSSGQMNEREFLRHDTFTMILMEFMIAEGLEEICWTWIRKQFLDVPRLFLMPEDSPEFQRLRMDIASTFNSFIGALCTPRPLCLDAAYNAFARASTYLPDLSIVQARRLLGPCVCTIIGRSKSQPSKRPSSNEAAFDSFLKLVPIARKHYEYDLAHLWVIHPTRPNVDQALAIMRDVRIHGPPQVQNPKLDSSRLAKRQRELEQRVMQLGLKSAEFLLEHNRYYEADEVMACLRLHFARHMGLPGPEDKAYVVARLEQAEAEAVSLGILDSIKFA